VTRTKERCVSTPQRQLAQHHRKLRELTQEEVQRRSGMSETEFSSVLRAVRSHVFVSLRALEKSGA
jgi:transcriptional regulator with XRE-family HTH domain